MTEDGEGVCFQERLKSAPPVSTEFFEWICPPSLLLRPLLSQPWTSSVSLAVVVGCGTSGLSKELKVALETADVVSLDSDPDHISYMKERQEEEGLTFHCCDVARQQFVAEGSSEMVVDKSTLDCLLITDRALGFVTAIFKMLRVGGRYVVLSFHEEDRLRKLFRGRAGWEWERCDDLARPVGKDVRLLVLRKVGEDPGEGGERVMDSSLDPLLDCAGEAKIRARWLVSAADSPQLPLDGEVAVVAGQAPVLADRDAYLSLFSEEQERSEYGLEDFRSDLRDWRKEKGGKEKVEASLGLEEALEFLRAMS